MAPLDLTRVALQVGCSATTLRWLFRTTFGMSMRDYHTRVRIRQALRLMIAGRQSVVDLAWAVGYRGEKNFYRAVRDLTGTTPARLMDWSAIALEEQRSNLENSENPGTPARTPRTVLQRAHGMSPQRDAARRRRRPA